MYSSVGACVHCNLVLENLYMISQFVALRLRDPGSESSLEPRRGGTQARWRVSLGSRLDLRVWLLCVALMTSTRALVGFGMARGLSVVWNGSGPQCGLGWLGASVWFGMARGLSVVWNALRPQCGLEWLGASVWFGMP